MPNGTAGISCTGPKPIAAARGQTRALGHARATQLSEASTTSASLPCTSLLAKAAKAALPSFKQYREKDGKFYFKFLAADGRLLLQSTGFDQPKVAGQTIAQLQQQGATALAALGTAVQLADAISSDDVAHALHVLQEASQA